VSGYPLAMVHAEKIVTAVARDWYGAIGQQRWEAWRRKQRLDDRLPSQFSDVVMAVVAFADPAIIGMPGGQSWDPATAKWS
jgi:hypothetical protein